MPFGLYLHIPYCAAKCRYCDFYSPGGSDGVPGAYIDRMEAELAARLPGRPSTLYFGGGTPGLLTPAQVSRLIRAASPLPGAEITLETNPELVSPQKLSGYRQAGVNRLSIGVQTARDETLALLGRRHTAQTARLALRQARQAGFENLCGDIMLALPHYSRAEFDATLDLIAGEGASHISAYLLKIEPGTVFGRRPPQGLPDGDEAADFYLYAVEQLEKAGYAQYEISNFARPGFMGRHNLIYWDCGDYLGLGPSAHSCMGGRRFSFPPDRAAFLAGNLPEKEEGCCTWEDYVLLRLRLRAGLNLKALKERYGFAFGPARLAFMKQLAASGYACFDGETLALTPAGLLVQNAILTELL